REALVLGALESLRHRPRRRDHELRPDFRRDRMRLGCVGAVDHDLGQAVTVAQVEEDQLAVVAPAMDPAREARLGSGVGRAQLAARMGAIRAREGAGWHGPVWYRAVTAGLFLIRRLRPLGEPAALRPLDESGAWTVDGTAGAGRIVHALAEAGI